MKNNYLLTLLPTARPPVLSLSLALSSVQVRPQTQPSRPYVCTNLCLQLCGCGCTANVCAVLAYSLIQNTVLYAWHAQNHKDNDADDDDDDGGHAKRDLNVECTGERTKKNLRCIYARAPKRTRHTAHTAQVLRLSSTVRGPPGKMWHGMVIFKILRALYI